MNISVDSPAPPAVQHLKLALLLGACGALSVVALFPYLLATMPQALEKVPVSLPVLAALQAAQGFVVLGVLSFLGLLMGQRVGLGAPWLQALLARRPRTSQAWGRAIVLGLVAGLLIVALAPLFDAALPAPLHKLAPPKAAASAWAGFLASFYGAISEEVMLRLFAMTLVVALLTGFGRRKPSAAVFWIGIVAAALLFGAGHLPAAAKIWPLDAIVVARTLVLNGVAGLVFGWLYWRQGLESAMASHFSADLVLHVAAPLVVGLLA